MKNNTNTYVVNVVTDEMKEKLTAEINAIFPTLKVTVNNLNIWVSGSSGSADDLTVSFYTEIKITKIR